MNQFVSNFLKGMGIGTANVVPGVSGGTIALLTGIFERLINCLKSFNITALKLLFKGKFKELAKHIDFWFLLSVGFGVVVAIFTTAKLFDYLFTHHPIYLWSFFFGMIITSIYFVGKTIDKWNWRVVLAFIIGTGIAVYIAFAKPASENNNFTYLMICGAIATCSMILPGLSGSFILIIMGNYQLVMIDSINNLDMQILVPVIIGAIVGLIAFSHFLSWIYKNYRNITIALLTGFILGSAPIIWPWKHSVTTFFGSKEKVIGYDYFLPDMDIHFATAIVIMLIGAALIILTEKLAAKKS